MKSTEALQTLWQFVRERHPDPQTRPSGHLGTERAPTAPVDREAMREQLAGAVRYQRKLVLFPILLAVAIFVMAAVLLILTRHDPKLLAAVFAATGLSVAAPVWWL